MATLKKAIQSVKQKQKNAQKNISDLAKKLHRLRYFSESGTKKFEDIVEREFLNIRQELVKYTLGGNLLLHHFPDYKKSEPLKAEINKLYDWCVDSIRILKRDDSQKRTSHTYPPEVDAAIRKLLKRGLKPKKIADELNPKYGHKYNKTYTGPNVGQHIRDMKKQDKHFWL